MAGTLTFSNLPTRVRTTRTGWTWDVAATTGFALTGDWTPSGRYFLTEDLAATAAAWWTSTGKLDNGEPLR